MVAYQHEGDVKMLNPIYDIGQQIYFSNLKYHLSDNSLDQSVISGFSVYKIITEKNQGAYIFTYMISDESGNFLTKKEAELFATQQDCQAYINTTIAAAIATLQNSIS